MPCRLTTRRSRLRFPPRPHPFGCAEGRGALHPFALYSAPRAGALVSVEGEAPPSGPGIFDRPGYPGCRFRCDARLGLAGRLPHRVLRESRGRWAAVL